MVDKNEMNKTKNKDYTCAASFDSNEPLISEKSVELWYVQTYKSKTYKHTNLQTYKTFYFKSGIYNNNISSNELLTDITTISVVSSLTTLGLMSSGSSALFGFKFRKSLAMPSQVTVISNIVW